MDKPKLITFWKKFFEGSSNEDAYMKILEMMIRGKSGLESEVKGQIFARNYQLMLTRAKCLGENNEILIEKLAEAYEKDSIDVHILSKALSGKLDQSFFSPLFDG